MEKQESTPESQGATRRELLTSSAKFAAYAAPLLLTVVDASAIPVS